MHLLKKILVTVAFSAGAVAHAENNDWLVRIRALNLAMDSQSSADVLPANAISVSDKVIPDINISYFFTPNWAAELVLTYPQEHDVEVSGIGEIGSFKHLPPTFTVAYHFNEGGAFRPYLGAGFNYTLFTDENMSVAGTPVTLDNSSFGEAYRAGFDWHFGDSMVLNLDVKKIMIGTDVYLGGSKISTLNVDPLAVGVGVGWWF